MSNYIYELDVTQLRIGYILPDHCYCQRVYTYIEDHSNGRREDLQMHYYTVIIAKGKTSVELDSLSELFTADSLPELIEKVRKWSVLNRLPNIERSPEDGTMSVISPKNDNSMTNMPYKE